MCDYRSSFRISVKCVMQTCVPVHSILHSSTVDGQWKNTVAIRHQQQTQQFMCVYKDCLRTFRSAVRCRLLRNVPCLFTLYSNTYLDTFNSPNECIVLYFIHFMHSYSYIILLFECIRECMHSTECTAVHTECHMLRQ